MCQSGLKPTWCDTLVIYALHRGKAIGQSGSFTWACFILATSFKEKCNIIIIEDSNAVADTYLDKNKRMNEQSRHHNTEELSAYLWFCTSRPRKHAPTGMHYYRHIPWYIYPADKPLLVHNHLHPRILKEKQTLSVLHTLIFVIGNLWKNL